jgi:hypothetical protein
MLYAILCYNEEDVVCAWSKEEDDAVMAKLKVVHGKLAEQGRLGPVARLLPTTAATTLNPGGSYEIRPIGVFMPGTHAA